MSEGRRNLLVPLPPAADAVIKEVDAQGEHVSPTTSIHPPVLNVPSFEQGGAGPEGLSVHPVPHYIPSTRVLGFIALAVLVVLSTLMAIPDQRPDACLSSDGKVDLCYCEVLRGGLVRQPSNALSGFAFPIAGIAMLWRRPTVEPGARTLFHRDKRIHLIWALTCILLGPASVAFHATFLMLPGLFDNLAILFWMSLFTAYHAGRALEWRGIEVLRGFALMLVGFFGVAVTTLVVAPAANGPHFVTEIAAGAALLSPLLAYLRHGFPGWRSERWLLAAVLTFALAFSTFVRAQTGGPWCVVDSWFQGHAAWHVLCVVAVWLAFEHARRTTP